MTEFEWSLKNGQIEVLRSEGYLAYVRSLPCSCCNAPPNSDPHHLKGDGFGGTGTKAGDDMAFPLCRACHDTLHRDIEAWEKRNGPQWKHVALTLMQFIRDVKRVKA